MPLDRWLVGAQKDLLRIAGQPDLITQNKVLVHIDVDPAEIGKNAGPTIPLVGDAAHIFEEFLNQECWYSRTMPR